MSSPCPAPNCSTTHLAWSLARQGRDLDRALALAREAIAGAGALPALVDTLATVHLARGEPEAALAAVDRALATAQGPARAELFALRARAEAAARAP